MEVLQALLAEAYHFSEVADLLMAKMDAAVSQSDETVGQLSQTYLSVVDTGIEKNIERAAATSVTSPSRVSQLAKIDQRNAYLMNKVEAFIEKNPGSSPPPLRKALAHQKQSSQRRNSSGR